MPRLTIRTLMVLTAFVAVGLTGLWASTDIWGNGIFTAVLAILTCSIILAVYREGEGRAFWIGFALFGGVYLAASRSPVSTKPAPDPGIGLAAGVVAEARLDGRLYDRGHGTEKNLVDRDARELPPDRPFAPGGDRGLPRGRLRVPCPAVKAVLTGGFRRGSSRSSAGSRSSW